MRHVVIAEPTVKDMGLCLKWHLDGQQVARRPDLNRRSVGDAGQNVFEPTGADQVGGGLEHAVQTLFHRFELLAELADLLR